MYIDICTCIFVGCYGTKAPHCMFILLCIYTKPFPFYSIFVLSPVRGFLAWCVQSDMTFAVTLLRCDVTLILDIMKVKMWNSERQIKRLLFNCGELPLISFLPLYLCRGLTLNKWNSKETFLFLFKNEFFTKIFFCMHPLCICYQ